MPRRRSAATIEVPPDDDETPSNELDGGVATAVADPPGDDSEVEGEEEPDEPEFHPETRSKPTTRLEDLPTYKVLLSGGLEMKSGDKVLRVTVVVHDIRAVNRESAIGAAATAVTLQLKSRPFCADLAEILDEFVPIPQKGLFDEKKPDEESAAEEGEPTQ